MVSFLRAEPQRRPVVPRSDPHHPGLPIARPMSPVKQVACPQCGVRVEWTPASKYRPFCSERCKLIDLGAWASESYRIPLAEPTESEDLAGPDNGTPAPPGRRGD
jgi:endogenous inhibitor of DNA gyrase (YacG/DUF329 family)